MQARMGLLLFTLCCGVALAAAAGVAEQKDSRTTGDPAEKRMDRYRAVQIRVCLQLAEDEECDTFACLKNMTCDVEDDLNEICLDYMQTATNLDSHGKQFTKDILKCSALGIKSRFSSSNTSCRALQRMLISVQAECYRLHNICPVTETNLEHLVNMIDLHKLLFNAAYVEYVRGLFDCGEKVIAAIRSHLQVQLGPTLEIFRHLWQQSCTRESTTPATVSVDINITDETIQRGNWK
ncbi:stanniocalcin-like [Mobula hypostoma]|uniref:stanniocalcin-like n=1 Tax=Mobula hypostoma TaxID=723540 RepID=UPI002FC29BC4